MNGADRIAKERQRQITEEHHTAARDDKYVYEELALAAACYALPVDMRNGNMPTFWPWDEKYWKPSVGDRVRDLEKAGALIAAEIDRLLRIYDL